MQYILADTTGSLNLAQLRGLQDFVVRPALTGVPGVAEIASLGGFEKEYQVEVDPAKLLAFGIPLEKVADAVRSSNQDVGGRCSGDGRNGVRREWARKVQESRRHTRCVRRDGGR